MAQVVPLTNAPNQSVRVALAVNGATLTLDLQIYFNSVGGFWAVDIADQFGKSLVRSVPLLTGAWPAANILAPFDHMRIGSVFVINQVGSASDRPDASNLGEGFLLVWDNN